MTSLLKIGKNARPNQSALGKEGGYELVLAKREIPVLAPEWAKIKKKRGG